MIPVYANLVSAAVMTGVIWFVQVVHYPLFGMVSSHTSVVYARENQRRTSLVVGPPMAIEGLASIWLFIDPPGATSRLIPTLSGLVLAVVLLSTILVQVPNHARLAEQDDDRAISDTVRRLVAGNWVRTIGWSICCGFAVAMLASAT